MSEESNNDVENSLDVSKGEKKQIIERLAVMMSKTHIGPLPDPETLTAYSSIIPNGAERIMQMAEKQQEHRINLESKVISGQLLQSNLGQIFALVIGLATIFAATYCIINGFEWAGTLLGMGGLTGLVTAFIKGKSQQKKP